MRKEELQSNLTLKFASGNIDITKLSQEKMVELGIADQEHNKIDTSKLRLGSLGAYISFSNESKDTISVTTSSIDIVSYHVDRLIQIVSGLIDIYPDVDILAGEIVTNWHLIGEELPDKILHQHSESEGYRTEVIQLKKGRNSLMLYQCGRKTVHVKHKVAISKKTKLKDVKLNNTFNFDVERTKLSNFINNIIENE